MSVRTCIMTVISSRTPMAAANSSCLIIASHPKVPSSRNQCQFAVIDRVFLFLAGVSDDPNPMTRWTNPPPLHLQEQAVSYPCQSSTKARRWGIDNLWGMGLLRKRWTEQRTYLPNSSCAFCAVSAGIIANAIFWYDSSSYSHRVGCHLRDRNSVGTMGDVVVRSKDTERNEAPQLFIAVVAKDLKARFLATLV